MHTHNMLMILNPAEKGEGYSRLYINGRRVSKSRWDLCECHARMGGSLDCYQTEVKRDGRIFHRHVARARMNFASVGPRKPDLSNRLPVRDEVETLTYHRGPTPGEIRFGEGATHYRDFDIAECCHEGTRIPKRWLIADDGLRYFY